MNAASCVLIFEQRENKIKIYHANTRRMRNKKIEHNAEVLEK